MELRQLRYFVSVVDAGSITRACDSLHVVQSAVSHQLRLLEDELGSSLLTRSVAGMSPTPTGMALYSHAQSILKQVEIAKSAVTLEDARVAGAVNIGIAGSTAHRCAVPLLAAVRANYPDVALSIQEGPSNVLTGALVAGKIDFAVIYASDATEGIDTHLITTEPLYFTSADPDALRQFRGQSQISLAELVRWPLLVQSMPGATRAALDRACMVKGIRYRVVAEVNSPWTLYSSVLANLGSTVLPWVSLSFVQGDHDIVVLPVTDPRLSRDVVLARRTGSLLSRAGEAIRQLAIGKLKELHETMAE